MTRRLLIGVFVGEEDDCGVVGSDGDGDLRSMLTSRDSIRYQMESQVSVNKMAVCPTFKEEEQATL